MSLTTDYVETIRNRDDVMNIDFVTIFISKQVLCVPHLPGVVYENKMVSSDLLC